MRDDTTKKWLTWIYILVFIVFLGAAFYFRSFLFANLILPVAQFFWAIYRVFASVNQGVYWVLLVGLVIFLAYRILFSIPKEAQDKYLAEAEKAVGREQFWEEAISKAIKNEEGAREFLHRQFGQLFRSASNLGIAANGEDPQIALSNLQSSLPPKLLSLLLDGSNEDKKRFPFQRWRNRRRSAKIARNEIEATITIMEDYLEIEHENEPHRNNLI